MRTCSQKNIEENSRRTEAGFHPECEPIAFNLKTERSQAGSIPRGPMGQPIEIAAHLFSLG